MQSVKRFLLDVVADREVQVIPQEYRAAPAIEFLCSTLATIQYAVLICVLVGFRTIYNNSLLRSYRGENLSVPPGEPPAWVVGLESNKMVALIGLFFGGNVIISMIKSSTAFEIFLKGNLVFSGLKSGTVPSTKLLATLLRENGFALKNG